MLLSQRFRITYFACIRELIQSSTRCARLLFQRVGKRNVQRETDSEIPLLYVTGRLINCVYLQRIGAPSQ
jgi:hypothetical protein